MDFNLTKTGLVDPTGGSVDVCGLESVVRLTVSYTHLTLPTILLV